MAGPPRPPDLWRTLIEIGPRRFTIEDTVRLRGQMFDIGAYTDPTIHNVDARFTLELIECLMRVDDSIKAMDATSTKLINTTNTLTTRILWLTVAGVIVGVGGLVEGFFALIK